MTREPDPRPDLRKGDTVRVGRGTTDWTYLGSYWNGVTKRMVAMVKNENRRSEFRASRLRLVRPRTL